MRITFRGRTNKKFRESVTDACYFYLHKLGVSKRKLNNVINFLGSSGKFSTLFSLKTFIEANGQTVTAYISPSLKDIKERFWIGNL